MCPSWNPCCIHYLLMSYLGTIRIIRITVEVSQRYVLMILSLLISCPLSVRVLILILLLY